MRDWDKDTGAVIKSNTLSKKQLFKLVKKKKL
jgi:hypothetical protein